MARFKICLELLFAWFPIGFRFASVATTAWTSCRNMARLKQLGWLVGLQLQPNRSENCLFFCRDPHEKGFIVNPSLAKWRCLCVCFFLLTTSKLWARQETPIVEGKRIVTLDRTKLSQDEQWLSPRLFDYNRSIVLSLIPSRTPGACSCGEKARAHQVCAGSQGGRLWGDVWKLLTRIFPSVFINVYESKISRIFHFWVQFLLLIPGEKPNRERIGKWEIAWFNAMARSKSGPNSRHAHFRDWEMLGKTLKAPVTPGAGGRGRRARACQFRRWSLWATNSAGSTHGNLPEMVYIPLFVSGGTQKWHFTVLRRTVSFLKGHFVWY